MSISTRRTLAAALATSLALAALFPVLQGASWLARVLGAVLVVAAGGLLWRRLRVPAVLQPVLSLVLLGGYLAAALVPSTFRHALPTAETLDALRRLATQGQADLDRLAPPVPADPGVVLLIAAGVGLVAVAVDLVAVLLDRAALAGLPLLLLFAVPSAVLPGGLGGVPFAVAATGWLVLLLEEGSDTVSRWGAPLRSSAPGARPGGDDPGLGQVGRRIGVAALGLALVVPMLVPELDARLLGGGGGSGTAAGEGPSKATTYNPLTRLRDQLVLPTPRQLLVYSTDDPTPDYLRMTTLDTYTGNGWESSKLEADREDGRVQDGIDAPRGAGAARTRKATTRVAVDGGNLDVHWLPVPFGPRDVDVDGTWLWDARSDTVFSASRTTRGLPPYRVVAERVLPERTVLETAAGIDPDVAARYGNALRLRPSVVLLAQRITRGARSGYAQAVAIQSWFTDPRNGYVYDLTPSQPRRGQDALEGFLEGKHGFCEQYATAMAVLLRAVGLPSRVAVGFTAGQRVPGKSGTYSVTTNDAHAWPEAWFAGSGWVRFEPTPGAAGATQPEYTLPESTQPGPGPADRPTPAPSASAFPRGFTDPDVLLDQRATPTGGDPQGAATGALGWLLGVVALLALTVPGVLGLVRRRTRHGNPESVWAQLHDDVTDTGGSWNPSESPRAAAQRLAQGLPAEARAALARVAEAVEVVRYAPPGRERHDDLRSEGAVVRRALRTEASRARRWRALLAPPSALRWAGHTGSERIADVLDVADRVVSALTAPVRRVVRLRQG